MKESTTKENHKTNDDPIYSKGIASRASFEVEIPPNGDFERQLEFQANLQPSEVSSTEALLFSWSNESCLIAERMSIAGACQWKPLANRFIQNKYLSRLYAVKNETNVLFQF